MNLTTNIGFGCVGLTAQSTQSKALNLLDCAYQNGIIFFDTAPIYGKGYSEIILGKFIKNKREKVVITTKFGLGKIGLPRLPPNLALPLNYFKNSLKKGTAHKTANNFNFKPVGYRCISKTAVEFDFNASLKRLNTNYIDNYLIHEGTPSFLTQEAKDFLYTQKHNGIIKNLGLGVNFKNLENISEAELKEWDILQYEHGLMIPTNNIYTHYPNKKHIYHSVLKSLPYFKSETINKVDAAGYLLAQPIINNPKIRVLFSSSTPKNIVSNLKNISLFFNKAV